MQILKKIRRNVEDYGMVILLQKMIAGLFGFLYIQRTYRVYFFDLTKPVTEVDNQSDLLVRKINPEEAKIIEQIEGMTEWLQGKLKAKLKDGDICLCALDRDTVAGYNLITFEKIYIPLLQITKQLKSKAAWSEQITVSKNYRRRGIARLLRNRIFTILQDSGYTRLFGGALISNTASLKLAEKVGFTMFLDMTFFRILLIKKWKIKKAWS